MQGREHRHKIVGSWKARHFPAEETKQRGKKRAWQKAFEKDLLAEELLIEERVGNDFHFRAQKMKIPELLQEAPGTKKGKLRKPDLIEMVKRAKINNAIKKHRIVAEGRAHTKRTAAYQLIARNFRDMCSSQLIDHKISCQTY